MNFKQARLNLLLIVCLKDSQILNLASVIGSTFF